ncbi:hypothetical protein [Pseudoduganella sp.]|uniref:hypothetical protein n=1 Tax=Pseudoduganella sp. TaxID=1880898 RepID=UPI0035B0AEE5
MQIERVPSLLQDVAEIRNWLVQHVPLSGSMVGYDLFLKIGNDCFNDKSLTLSELCKGLPHSESDVRQSVSALVQAGLLEAMADSASDSVRIVPTQRFMDLLKQYQSKFESVFIPRKDLRVRQLYTDVHDQRLHHLVETMYDHFHDIGWVHLHKYGAVCFLMASLVKRIATAYGFKARVEFCHATIATREFNFNLGTPGYAAPGQIEGHAVCIVDEAVLVDFALSSVRRQLRRDFYWGLAAEYAPHDVVMAQVDLPEGGQVAWKNDWQTPDGPGEIAKYEMLVEELFKEFVARFG